jgi:transposase-like protein
MNPTISTRTTKTAGGPRRSSRSKEVKAQYLALFERSGKSVSAFCREHGMCEQTFYYWRNRLRPGAVLPAVKAGFAEVAVEAASVSSNIIVHLNTGVLLELPVGANPAWVGRLVGELRAR